MPQPYFRILFVPLLLLLSQCTPIPPAEVSGALSEQVTDAEQLPGRTEYLNSPFVTAGDRVYLVGHQNGQFPDLGWHVTGEMGGLWDHPIKLLDGFTATVTERDQPYCLAAADSFINYPFANRHVYREAVPGVRIERFQFAPDAQEAIAIEYTLTNTTDSARTLTVEFTAYSDLRPVWLGERTDMVDYPDSAYWRATEQRWVIKDRSNPWFVTFGSTVPVTEHTLTEGHCSYDPAGQGVATTLRFVLDVPAESTARLPITIAGSYVSEERAQTTYAYVQQYADSLLRHKQARYRTLAQQTKLTVPDKDLQQAFRWVKYNTDWLIRDVPEQGRGLSAGLPDYPWWFGVDNAYSLQGALAIGQWDIVYSTIDLVHRLSEATNGNGRVMHEASTNGAVFNPGNVNETPQFASLIRAVYQWTGDQAFLEKYYPFVVQGLDWLWRENDADGNGLPDGFGMMEIHGLNSEMIDVAAYSQRALVDAAAMARVMGDTTQADAYQQRAERLKQTINTQFWVPASGSYADFIGTPEQARHLLADALVRADSLDKPWAVEELQATQQRLRTNPPTGKQGFVLHHNWVVNTPLEMGIADSAQARMALETARRFTNPFGMFVTGIDRDAAAGEDAGSFAQVKKTFSYTGAVMTLPTGVQAIAENNYGHPDRALDYLQRMTRSFGYALPGSIYEVSPDYGMMTQAWNVYSYAIPVVQQFFGIRPEAGERKVRLQPQLPSAWDSVRVENVRVGDNHLDVAIERSAERFRLTVNQAQPDWTIEVALPTGKFRQWRVNGQPVTTQREDGFDMGRFQGESLVLEATSF
ncbi:MAG: glycogen debranching protein [Tunicatimonas sp.]